jgi:hypothetical protein
MEQEHLELIIQFLEHEKPKYQDIKLTRLEGIIAKIKRFSNNELNHPEDLTEEELEQQDLKVLKEHILKLHSHADEPCVNLRHCIDNEGLGYYFTDYAGLNTLMSFETFNKFTQTDDFECLCGKGCKDPN